MDMGGNPLGKPLASRAENRYLSLCRKEFSQFQPRPSNGARFSICEAQHPGEGQ
jgi:hypothetical protein